VSTAVLKAFERAAKPLHKDRTAAERSAKPVAIVLEVVRDAEQRPDMAKPVLLMLERLIVYESASPIRAYCFVHRSAL
jgi:hypothetical protein